MSDISKKQDLVIAVMNLISLEEHLTFSYLKTKDKEFLEGNKLIRNMRRKYMKELKINDKAEIWCISKHILSSIMRLIEVSNKNNDISILDDVNKLSAYFWILNNGATRKNKK